MSKPRTPSLILLALVLLTVIAAGWPWPANSATTFDNGVQLGQGETYSLPHSPRRETGPLRLIGVVCPSGAGGRVTVKDTDENGVTLIDGTIGAGPDTLQFPMYDVQLAAIYVNACPATCAVNAYPGY